GGIAAVSHGARRPRDSRYADAGDGRAHAAARAAARVSRRQGAGHEWEQDQAAEGEPLDPLYPGEAVFTRRRPCCSVWDPPGWHRRQGALAIRRPRYALGERARSQDSNPWPMQVMVVTSLSSRIFLWCWSHISGIQCASVLRYGLPAGDVTAHPR